MKKIIKNSRNKIFIKGELQVYIDAANILYSQKTLKWLIDPVKIHKYFTKKFNATKTSFYTGKIGDFSKQVKFIRVLEKNGIAVVAKEVKFIKSNGAVIPKGNLDVELAIDAYRFAPKYQTIALFSGDSDFSYLLERLKQDYEINSLVFSTRGHISRELILSADKYFDIRKFRAEFEYIKSGVDRSRS